MYSLTAASQVVMTEKITHRSHVSISGKKSTIQERLINDLPCYSTFFINAYSGGRDQKELSIFRAEILWLKC